MFSKQEAQELKREFWTSFGKSFPRKWILYNTKIKDFNFKFSADNKSAEVSLNIEMDDELFRNAYFEKMQSLENILLENLGEFHIDEHFYLDNGKKISKIWVKLDNVSIFNKNSWQDIFQFFITKMSAFEKIFIDFEDFIKNI
jgi:hypothetical protein